MICILIVLTAIVAPLRSSERRKLRARTAERFKLAPEVADNLVPDGLLSQKFSAYNGESGVSERYLEAGCPCDTTVEMFWTIGPLPLGGRQSTLVQYWEGFG